MQMANRGGRIGSLGIAACLVSAAVALVPRSGQAANEIPKTNGDGLDTHLFRPAVDSKGFVTVNGTQVLPGNQISFGLVIDYANVLLRTSPRGQEKLSLIDHSFQGTFHFNYGIKNVAVVGLSMPFNLMAGPSQVDAAGTPVYPGRWTGAQLDSQNLGFVSLHGKVQILRVEKGFGLAALVPIGVPLTNSPRSGGADPKFWFWPQLLAEKRFGKTDWLKLGLNAGFRGHITSDTTLDLRGGTLKDGNRLTYGFAAAARVLPAVDLVGETYATYLLSDSAAVLKPSNEAVGGLKVFVEKNSYFLLGAGARYTKGFEAANIRAFLGFVYEPSIGDRDGDGILDDIDQCPDEKEDFDGFEDEDGCPDPDNDKDGVPDYRDRCPNVPGPVENQGCPKPEGDRDGDGTPDSKDKCPDVPGPKSNFGCPLQGDGDRDHDLIPDSKDKCPNEPETYNGVNDEDGCPDNGDVVVTDGGIVILKKIQFKTGSAEILPASDPILDQVAFALKGHPEFALIEVAGHADERSTDQYNLNLTQKRVDAVVAALVTRGAEKSRLRAKGYGEYCPEDEEHNEAAWEKNRRVEFKIVKNTNGGPAPDLGCANALKHGVKPDPIP